MINDIRAIMTLWLLDLALKIAPEDLKIQLSKEIVSMVMDMAKEENNESI